MPVVRKLAGRRSLYAVREYNHGHIKARELREALPPEAFDGFFKFAFVRNPWDWHDVPLPHLNRSAHADFHEYYRPAAEALVREAYAADIARFDYSFEPQNDVRPG